MRLRDILCILKKHKAPTRIKTCRNNNGNFLTHAIIEIEYEKYRSSDTSSDNNRDSAEFIEHLISKGFDFDQQNSNRHSALYLAINYNVQHILPVLFKHTNIVHSISEGKRTLLHKFFAKHYELQGSGSRANYAAEIVKILLDRGVSVDFVDKDGLTALEMAINAGEQADIVEMLIDRCTIVKDNRISVLIHKVIRNIGLKPDDSLRILHAMLGKGVNVNSKDKYGLTPVHYAVTVKHLPTVELMKRYRVNFRVTTKDGRNLLYMLAGSKKQYSEPDWEHRMTQLFDIIVGEGCDVKAANNAGKTPLHRAAETANSIVLKKLLQHGANVNCRENLDRKTPLHIASRSGFFYGVYELLNFEAQVNSPTRDKNRPIHKAAALKLNTFMLEELLSRGAFVNARNKFGHSAFGLALRTQSIDCLRIMLSYGANINDKFVVRTLHACADYVIEIVLQHWIKLKVAGLPCFEGYEDFIDDVKYQEIYEKCLSEVEELKKKYIDDKISIYDWLHMDLHQQCLRSQDKKLCDFVYSPILTKQFPLYWIVILGSHRESLARKPLWEVAKETWIKMTGIYLPDLCLERVFAYLDCGDLLDIIGLDGDGEESAELKTCARPLKNGGMSNSEKDVFFNEKEISFSN